MNQGDHEMGFYPNPDTRLEMAKDKIREFHQEAEAWRLAKEARQNQPGRIRVAVKQAINLCRLLLLKKRIVFGRIQQKKVVRTRRDTV